jgi:hypothetical protein
MNAYTLGYGGRTKEEALALLRSAGVKSIVDVQLTVGILARDESGCDAVDLLFQVRIAGVRPRQRGGMKELADVLADPVLAAGSLAEPAEQFVLIDDEEPRLLIGRHPRAEIAGELHIRWAQSHRKIGHLVGDLVWNHLHRRGDGGSKNRKHCGQSKQGFLHGSILPRCYRAATGMERCFRRILALVNRRRHATAPRHSGFPG